MRIEPRHQIGHGLFLALLLCILADTHNLQGRFQQALGDGLDGFAILGCHGQLRGQQMHGLLEARRILRLPGSKQTCIAGLLRLWQQLAHGFVKHTFMHPAASKGIERQYVAHDGILL